MKTTHIALFFLSIIACLSLQAEEPKFDKLLLPIDVHQIQEKARAEILKQRPDFKSDDLQFSGIMYMLNPAPDYAIQKGSDGAKKNILISDYYEQLSVAYILKSTKRDAEEGGKPVVIADTLNVIFPNARSKEFSISKGKNTQYR